MRLLVRLWLLAVASSATTSSAAAAAEIDTDTCEWDEHCLHGGKCEAMDQDSPKHCTCPEGYNGLRCEKHCPLQCSNGGRCYVVSHDQHDHDHHLEHQQEHNPQNHGGGSQKQKDEPSHDEFMTLDLANPSDTNPKESGTNDGDDESTNFQDYACHCKGLFTGSLCDIPYTNCGDMTRCFYGGKCQLDSITEPCQCAPGYMGRYCEQYNENGGTSNFEQVTDGSSSSSKKPWPLLLGSIGLGSILGIAAFIWKERRRRFYANWLVTSNSGSTLSFEEASPRTYVNVI